MELYQKRLEHLPPLLEQLFPVISEDESLKYLEDPALAKYRIDRIGEIVVQIMNSEKERMLIKVIEEYDQLKKKFHENEIKVSDENNRNLFRDGWIQKQQHEIVIDENQRLKQLLREKQIGLKQIGEKLQKVREKNVELQILLTEKNKEVCKGCEKEMKKRIEKEEDLTNFKKMIQKEQKIEIQELNERLEELQKDNQQLNKKNIDLQYQIGKLKQANRISEDKEKKERIEVLSKHVRFLEQELIQIQRSLTVIKERVLYGLLSEIKSLKKQNSSFKIYITETLSYNIKSIMSLVQKNMIQFDSNKPLLQTMTELNEEIDYFLENQVQKRP